MQVGDRLTGARLERSMLAANTLTLDLFDGDRNVLRSGVLGLRTMSRLAVVELDGLRYSVAGVSRSGDTLTLTCEDAVVVRLKRHGKTRPLRASRNTITRVGFVAQMFRAAGVPVLVLDEGVRQPIAGAATLRRELEKARREASSSETGRTSSRGETASGLTIKGRPADSEQRRVMAAGLAEAAELRASELATLTLLDALIQESTARNLPGGDLDSAGALQVRASTGRSENVDPRNVRAVCRLFLTRGARGRRRGAITVARENPTWTPGQIIREIWNPGTPTRDYDQHTDEARAWLEARGTVGDTTGGSGNARVRQYAFERRKGESSWAAGRRLLDEVAWRMFVREGVVVLASDVALMRARPSLVLDDTVDHWDPDFEWHRALRVSEMTGQIAAGRYQADPGEVVEVRDLPQIEARWLIGSATVDLLNPDAPVDLALRRPQDPRKEPASEVVTSSSGDAASGGLRARIVAEAEKTLTTRTGFRRYSQAGALSENPTPAAPARTDCSQWVRAVYLRAGAPDPGTNTWEQARKGKRTSRPKPGDLMMSANTGHVELYVGPDGKTIGHGTPPIDEANVSAWPGHYFVTFDVLDEGDPS